MLSVVAEKNFSASRIEFSLYESIKLRSNAETTHTLFTDSLGLKIL